MNTNIWNNLINHLKELAQKSPLAIAYSGGLDSRFLAHAAQKAGCDIKLYHVRGLHIPSSERKFALSWAKQRSIILHIFPMQVHTLEHIDNNSKMRCYYCKKHLMRTLRFAALQEGRLLCDGTNADDLNTHRPGLMALIEENISSPLADCALGKKDLYVLAKTSGLEFPEQKASPCLLTRFAYDMKVDAKTLMRLDLAESALYNLGLTNFRLRLSPNPILQSQPYAIDDNIIHSTLAQYGFEQVQIIQEDNISGFFDRQ